VTCLLANLSKEHLLLINAMRQPKNRSRKLF